MKILTGKQMKELLARFDTLESRLDRLESKFDNLDKKVDNLDKKVEQYHSETQLELNKINDKLDSFQIETQLKFVEVNASIAKCYNKFNCMDKIVSSLLTIIVLGGGAYLVNQRDVNNEAMKEFRQELKEQRALIK